MREQIALDVHSHRHRYEADGGRHQSGTSAWVRRQVRMVIRLADLSTGQHTNPGISCLPAIIRHYGLFIIGEGHPLIMIDHPGINSITAAVSLPAEIALQVVTRQRANHQPHDEQRNRFTVGSVSDVIGQRDTYETGIWSMMDPPQRTATGLIRQYCCAEEFTIPKGRNRRSHGKTIANQYTKHAALPRQIPVSKHQVANAAALA